MAVADGSLPRRLLVASLRAKGPEDFEMCQERVSGPCPLPFAIVAVDPETLATEDLYVSDGSPMGAGTVGLQVGDQVMAGQDAEIQPGNALPLTAIPVGTVVHAVELKPGKGAQIVRSAGTGAQLMAREGKYATLKLPSGEMRMVQDPRRRELEDAMRRISDELARVGIGGGIAVPDSAPTHPDLELLSRRERDVVTHLLQGHRVVSIAELLEVSEHTVRNHLKSIFRKLGVHSQAELVDRLHSTPVAS